MAVEESLDGQRRAYARWAPFYDNVYNRFLSDAHRRTAAAAAAFGPDILEVGVGTGLVLPYYPPGSRVIGVDLSEPMLRRAASKVRGEPLRHVQFVAAMDACRLGFPNARFDGVAVPFVITLVPDPERALDEALRVLKPGGAIAIASKLGEDKGLQARAEEAIDPVMKRLGWSAAFKVSRIAAWARARGNVEVLSVEPLFPAGFFKLMRLRKAP